MADKLSQRVRPNCEAAPWVVEEIKNLESELEATKAELQTLKVGVDNWEGYSKAVTLASYD